MRVRDHLNDVGKALFHSLDYLTLIILRTDARILEQIAGTIGFSYHGSLQYIHVLTVNPLV